jgi:hypothetical protein
MRSQKKQFDAHPQQLTERLSTLSEKGARIETRPVRASDRGVDPAERSLKRERGLKR